MSSIKLPYTSNTYTKKEYLQLIESRLKKSNSKQFYKVEKVKIQKGPPHLMKLAKMYLEKLYPRISIVSKGEGVLVVPFDQEMTNNVLWKAFQNQNFKDHANKVFFLAYLSEADIKILCAFFDIKYVPQKPEEMPYTKIIEEEPSLGFSLNKSLMALMKYK